MATPVRSPRPGAARLTGFAAAATALALVAGCGGGSSSTTEEQYCGAVGQHLAELNSPNVATPADVDATLAMYRTMLAKAPAAVQDEWAKLAADVATAATVNPGDPSSLQTAADTARAAQAAAQRIQQYTQQICSLQLGQATTAPTTSAATTTSTKKKPTTSTTKPKKKKPTSTTKPTKTTTKPTRTTVKTTRTTAP